MPLSVTSCVLLSLQVKTVLILQLFLDLKRAFWPCTNYGVWMLATEGSKNTQPIDCPINGELLACLAEAGSSKKKRTNDRGKGGLDRLERLRNTARNQEIWLGGGVETTDRWEKILKHAQHRFVNRMLCWATPRPQLAPAGKTWLSRLHSAVGYLLVLPRLRSFVGSWRPEGKLARISAPLVTLQHWQTPFPLGLLMHNLCECGLSCLSGRTCQKAHGWWIPAVSMIVVCCMCQRKYVFPVELLEIVRTPYRVACKKETRWKGERKSSIETNSKPNKGEKKALVVAWSVRGVAFYLGSSTAEAAWVSEATLIIYHLKTRSHWTTTFMKTWGVIGKQRASMWQSYD